LPQAWSAPVACVFCAIVQGALPAAIVAESDRALAIMDSNPVNDGHVLILTRAHAETLLDIAEADLLEACRLARKVAKAMHGGLALDGLHLLQNSGRAARQSVLHFHLHLIPRWRGDGKGFDWPLVPGDAERIRAAAERIRAALEVESRRPRGPDVT
jgi:histidine triad (HIT) family protein